MTISPGPFRAGLTYAGSSNPARAHSKNSGPPGFDYDQSVMSAEFTQSIECQRVLPSGKRFELPPPLSPSARPREPRKQAKLGYLQQRELDGMQEAIEAAERRKAEIESALADPSNYSTAERVQELSGKLSSVSAEVERLYSRWQELECE